MYIVTLVKHILLFIYQCQWRSFNNQYFWKLYDSVPWDKKTETGYMILVVYRSSETSTNQSDVIIRSDDRFLNLVVDSDSIVSKIYMLSFVLWLVFFSVSILTKILQFYPSWVFLPSYWQTSNPNNPVVILRSRWSLQGTVLFKLTNIWQFCPSVLLTLSQYTYLD
jgi:hypothetical protein